MQAALYSGRKGYNSLGNLIQTHSGNIVFTFNFQEEMNNGSKDEIKKNGR